MYGSGMSDRREISYVTPDLSQLKALAHPVRTKMLGLLRLDGPATATQLAQQLGLNSGATSYHLRQLEQHGLVVEDHARGNNRDRWWRAAHEGTTTRRTQDDDEARQVMGAYVQAVQVAHLDQLTAAFQERNELPEPWSEIAVDSDWVMWLSPDQARTVVDRLHHILAEVVAGTPADKASAAPDAEQFMFQLHGFPRPGSLVYRDADQEPVSRP
jgi:DNA-binding transcriptional ArsR family regulator